MKKKNWLFILLVWVIVIFSINYFFSQNIAKNQSLALIVSFFRVTSGLIILYKLLLDDYIKEIFKK